MPSHANDFREMLDLLNARDVGRRCRKTHRLPLERYSATDCDFFFTICARHQGKVFLDDALARRIIDALLWRRDHHDWHLFCYCLMPDHLHFILRLLVEDARILNGGIHGPRTVGVLDQVGWFKSYTTTQCWWNLGGSGELWQTSSYDRVIRYTDSVDDAVAYVLNNPVRKGIVEEWSQYPYAAIIDPL